MPIEAATMAPATTGLTRLTTRDRKFNFIPNTHPSTYLPQVPTYQPRNPN